MNTEFFEPRKCLCIQSIKTLLTPSKVETNASRSPKLCETYLTVSSTTVTFFGCFEFSFIKGYSASTWFVQNRFKVIHYLLDDWKLYPQSQEYRQGFCLQNGPRDRLFSPTPVERWSTRSHYQAVYFLKNE